MKGGGGGGGRRGILVNATKLEQLLSLDLATEMPSRSQQILFIVMKFTNMVTINAVYANEYCLS